jgi:hypothetical protein
MREEPLKDVAFGAHMAKRILIAGLLGGVVLYIWVSLAHTVLGLGETGVKEIPNEQAVTSAIHASIPEPGLYIFPGMGMTKGISMEQEKAAMEKALGGPYGILIYHPSGATFVTPRRLLVQFALNLVQAFFCAILLAWGAGRASYGSRVGFVFIIGLLASLSTNVEYWNWYSFPPNYTLAYMSIQLIGFLLVGIVVAAIVRKRALA